MKFEEIKVGDSAEFSKTITEADIILFAGITGDINPIHISEKEAKKSIFKKRVAHGVLILGLISAVLGNKLPGPGSIYLKQTVIFRKPVFVGDTITAIVEVKEKDLEKKRILLRTECRNQENKIILEGEALVLKD